MELPAKKREDLILILHQEQEKSPENFISFQRIKAIAREFEISLSEISGIISFYSLFSTLNRGKYMIRICDSLPCRISGSIDVFLYLQEKLGIKNKETTPDKVFTLEMVNCLGACDKAPTIMINDKIYSAMTPEKIDQMIDFLRQEALNA